MTEAKFGGSCRCGMHFDLELIETEFRCDRCGAKWRIYEDENFKGTWHYSIDFKPYEDRT